MSSSKQLFTIQRSRSQFSNTFRKVEPSEDLALLEHPLAPGVYLLKPSEELNKAAPLLKTPVENAISFCSNNESVLGYTDVADLKSIAIYSVVYGELTRKQRATLNSLCGKVASRLLTGVGDAASVIRTGKALLDEYSIPVMNKYDEYIRDFRKIDNKKQLFAIFELAGFILAQQPSQ